MKLKLCLYVHTLKYFASDQCDTKQPFKGADDAGIHRDCKPVLTNGENLTTGRHFLLGHNW